MATLGNLNTVSTMMTTTTKPAYSPAASLQHSPWHSPVPYLFGGLAAMLGLITFALLLLACSYLKFSGRLDDRENGDRDLEAAGDEKPGKALPVFEEKIVVIMAGDVKPTFLATPMCSSSRDSSFGDGNSEKERETDEVGEKPKHLKILQH